MSLLIPRTPPTFLGGLVRLFGFQPKGSGNLRRLHAATFCVATDSVSKALTLSSTAVLLSVLFLGA